MDMTTMAVASNAIAMANQTAQLSEGLDTGTIDFSSLLASMTGGDATATDMNSVLGMSAQDLQTSMLLNAMGAMSQAQRPVVTDPELAALLNQMGNLNNLDDGQLQQLLEQMRDRLKKLTEESGTLAAGQQAVAMLANMMFQTTGTEPDSSTLSVMNGNSDAILETIQNGGTGDILNLLTTLQTQSTVSAASQQLSGMNDLSSIFGEGSDNSALLAIATAQANANASVKAAQSQSTTAGTSQKATQSPTGQAAQGAEATVTTGGQQSGGVATGSFEAAVRTAKQQLSDHVELKADKVEAEDDGLDIDALQQRVDSGVYFRNTALATQAQPAAILPEQAATPPEVQISQTIDMALKTGEETLTLKLNPEELGEVTIRLTKSAEGGIQLNIVAQSTTTQALLADQIDALKVAMKPLDVEVGSILSQAQYETMNQNEGRQNRHNDGQAMHGAAYYGDEPLAAGEAAEQTAKTTPYAALDTYI
ncbi:flagellar hook-length control protein FliK [Ruminococcaceae bacterium OttesenSCG-928-A11]|nr:flagellar hook-length control protein FliK [Ruminococcaceae bacterium OttesenSCG-928-A11]